MPNTTSNSKTVMVPDFLTTEFLQTWRRWRPEQVDGLLGQPDAIFAGGRGKRRHAFFRYRVEAAEQTIGFRAHEDSPDKPLHSWMTMDAALMEAVHEIAWRAFESPRPKDFMNVEPIFRLDDTGLFRCKACGAINGCYDDAYFGRCSRWHKPTPLRIEQTRRGYKIIKSRGALFADFPSAKWALPLALAITGRRWSPPAVIPEQLELFDFAGGAR